MKNFLTTITPLVCLIVIPAWSCGKKQYRDENETLQLNLDATAASISILPPNDLERSYSSYQLLWQEEDDQSVPPRSLTTAASKKIALMLSPLRYRFTVNLMDDGRIIASSQWGKCQSQTQIFALTAGRNNLPLILCTDDGKAGLLENPVAAPSHEAASSTTTTSTTLIPKDQQFGFNLSTVEEESEEHNSDDAELRLQDDSAPLAEVLAFGDSGTGDANQKKVADAMLNFCHAHHCDYGVMLGDNIYEDGVVSPDDPQFKTKFEDMYRPLGIPFYLALGNHDVRNHTKGIQGQIAYSNISPIWRMPDRFYSAREGEIEYFALDTNTFSDDPTQISWLKDGLKKSDATWKVVFAHHPMYSVGDHALGDMIEGFPMKRLRKKLGPILCDYGADMFLTGHEHHMEVNLSECGVLHVLSGASAKMRNTSWWLKKFHKDRRLYSLGNTLGFAHLSFFEHEALLRLVDSEGALLFQTLVPKREKG
jgi:hypothetical protein